MVAILGSMFFVVGAPVVATRRKVTMGTLIGDRPEAPAVSRHPVLTRDAPWYVAAVLVGAVLVVIAALIQPFNQNELQQMGPYASHDLSTITSRTRQPPLDPLFGALVQHLLGEGQFRQRLVPVMAGIGTLILTALLMRHLRLGILGALAVTAMATAPLFVRYTAYTRPYALPLFFMMVFVYAGQRWLDNGDKRWLILVAAAAAALPATRVTEPTVFLLVTVMTMAWLGLRQKLAWNRAGPLVAIPLLALAVVGYPMAHTLQSETPGLWDPNPGIAERFGAGTDELVGGFLPLMAQWFPVWPLTLLVVACALAIPDARRRVFGWWFFWPLAAAPILFVLAYHFMTTINFVTLPYHSRAAYFFIPPFVLLVAALAESLRQSQVRRTWVNWAVGLAVAAALLGQLPTTVRAATQPDVPDFAAASQLISEHVPADAVVLYDRPTEIGVARMSFLAKSRYLDDPESVIEVSAILKDPASIPAAPIYLMINGQCTPETCNEGAVLWSRPVEGWRLVATRDRFALYAPTARQVGRPGAEHGLAALAESLGPRLGYLEALATASLQRLDGHFNESRATVRRLFAASGAEHAADLHELARLRHLE